MSFVFYFLSYIFSFTSKSNYAVQFEARWSLWSGAIISLGTVGAGIYAFLTVHHDDVAFAAMQIHRKFATVTAILVILTAIWSLVRYIRGKQLSLIFLVVMFLIQIPLLAIAWLGSEVVYKYGVGVMSLPK